MDGGETRCFYEAVWRRKISNGRLTQRGREQNALPYVPQRSRILDVGCGEGALLRRAPFPIYAVGADIALAALHVASRNGIAVVRATFDGPHLPFRNGAFDCVTCLDVIEHLFDPRSLLREIHRVLRGAGILILQTPNVRHYLQVYRLAVEGRGPRTSGDPEGVDGGHVHYFTVRDVAVMLHETGFGRLEFRGTEGVRLLRAFRSLGVLAIARRAP